MVRPCFIVVDPEHSGSISTRKLVIESAKLNVITAYSGAEAIETLKRYPAVDGVVCNYEVRDIPLPKLIAAVKQCNPKVPVVTVGAADGADPKPDRHVDSYDPRQLLDTLQSLAPHKVATIEEIDDRLREEETAEGSESS
jgi:DNA-binding NtrC family response regulator